MAVGVGIHHQRLFAVALAVLAVVTTSATPAAAAGSRAASAATAPQRLTLVTGEQVVQRVDAAGRSSVEAVARAGGSPLLTYRLGAVSYVVPAVAVPFLGAELDPALFDSAALAGRDVAGQVPVLVRWHTPSRPSLPWLVHPRDTGVGTTTGEVSSASGASLERDLAGQPRSSSGRWSGTLQGVDSISLDRGVPASPRRPQFVQYTLTVKGIDAAGAPDTGDFAVVVNTDNIAKFVAGAVWIHGVLKLSVPAGHYSAVGSFFSFSPTGGSAQIASLDFTVAGNTTTTIDARSATAPVSVSTPRAAPDGFGTVEWQRSTAGGGSASVGLSWQLGFGAPPTAVSVNPVPPPRVGGLSWLVSFHLDSPAQAPTPYSYDLAFESVGAIGADQHYVVAPSQLASVDTRYFTDVAGSQAGESRLSFFPDQFFGFGVFDQFAAPLQRTEYLTALPQLVWSQTVVQDLFDFAGFSFDSNRVFQPGQRAAADWGRGPIGPGVAAPTGGAVGLQGCPACTESGTLEFAIFPFGDNPPGHTGFSNNGAPGVTETDAYDLVRDGVSIAAGQDPLGIVVPVPAGPARYQLGYSVSMSAPWWTLSTSVSTRWTFATPASTQGVPPPGWVCFSGQSFGCNVIALMMPDYTLNGDLTNHVASGPTSFQLGIQHILGVAIAATRATVSVSFDGGLAWSAARVTANPSGGFTVAYTNTPGAATASLRIHVVDADGGVLDQTIINAYAIS